LRPPYGIGVVAGNIGDRETGEAMVGVAVDSIDVLVNNAGTFGLKYLSSKLPGKTSTDIWAAI
jgi:NAD(P)-dependent dehydrogenase (short-subunit alcohol dehydrogenase family)